MRSAKRLSCDQGGAALVEFALIVPVLLILLMGGFDMAHRLYARAVLQGAVQKAARDTGLEDGTVAARQTAIDTKVRDQARLIHNGATFTFDRRSYRTFTRAAEPAETWTDTNGDKVCNAGEPFNDVNRNGTRDADVGVSGQGGAQDAVVYSVRMQYPAVTPVFGLIGINRQVDLTARTVLRNQPYNDQGSELSPIAGNCA